MKRHVNIPAHWIEISLADASLTQLAMPWQEINTFNSGTWEVSSENMLILSWEAQRPSVGTLAADPEEWWNTVIVLHFYLEIVKDLQEGPAQPWPSFLWWSHLHNHRGCTNAKYIPTVNSVWLDHLHYVNWDKPWAFASWTMKWFSPQPHSCNFATLTSRNVSVLPNELRGPL